MVIYLEEMRRDLLPVIVMTLAMRENGARTFKLRIIENPIIRTSITA